MLSLNKWINNVQQILLKHKEKLNHCICRKIDITAHHYVKQNKPFP